MKKSIGVLAHVDAGKTTFSEAILYHTNSIRKRGRVDHKDAYLDCHKIEKDRGITIFQDQGMFEFNNSTYYLIDTPGHIDFSTEMERAIKIMDYAIIIISAVEGVQSHTKTVWNLLRTYKVPTVIFINKIDRDGVDIDKAINSIKKELSKDIVLINMKSNEDKYKVDINDELMEFVSEYDDELLEKYLEGEGSKEEFEDALKKNIKENKIFPCFKGSALNDIGICEFLYGLDELTYTDYDKTENYENEFIGYVYKIRHDENGNRLTFVKCLNGELKVKDEVIYGNDEENQKCEKVNGIRAYSGNKYKAIDVVKKGDLAAIVGISSAACGQSLGVLEDAIRYELVPTLVSSVIFDKSYNVKDVLNNFKILESEDPSLNVIWNENLSEIQVHIMGKIQLQVLKEIIKDRFNMDVEFGKCRILYKETINEKTYGCGHFEPLKHYAEVHLLIEPGKRNSGITFENKCHVDDLAISYQKLIRSHTFEREHNGILTGSALADVKITLINGRSHLKHTCGGDFREATFRAIRQGLEKVENKLLEPFYKFKIVGPKEYLGRFMSDIQKLYGTFEPPINENDDVIIYGRGPVSTFMDYPLEIIAFSKGKGNINFIYDGYDFCHNEEEVIEEIGYDKHGDKEYTANSVFCSHGKGYTVKSEDCDEAMHVQIEI